ncbi:Peptide N-acetyl-beta-D-glucosaminyl asparaginase amidase A domain containing protein [Amanita muscaria]
MVVLAASCFVLACFCYLQCASSSDAGGSTPRQLQGDTNGFLDVFEVYKPVAFAPQGSGCDQQLLLMEHQFALSYGHPFIGDYQPPKCDFDTVKINFTVTSKGRQFDRLALMYLGDAEVFRTSTAEPTQNGIIWTYIKDMSQYTALWKQPQKLIFDLGNLIDSTYTGAYNTTLTASFSKQNNIKTPDVVLPISAKRSATNGTSAFIVPSDNATVSVAIPAAASRAVVSISACGQINEEFWWSNVFNQDMFTFNATTGILYGYSPFREVQLYIDKNLAGVVWPFPTIFTGGVVPGFWRSIVGIDAFDLRMPEIDISPFLSYLTDGKEHSFSIKVVGLDTQEDGTAKLSDGVGYYWVITGNIFLYLGEGAGSGCGKGVLPHIVAPDTTFTTSRQLVQNRKTGANESVSYSVTAKRTLTVTSPAYTWVQTLSFSNYGLLDQQGFRQWNKQNTGGELLANVAGSNAALTTFSYPLEANTTFGVSDTGSTIDAWLNRGLSVGSNGGLGVSTFTLANGPSNLVTKQYGSAHYGSFSNAPSYSFGDTTDEFEETSEGSTYSRTVRAVNGTVISDTQGGRQFLFSERQVPSKSLVDPLPIGRDSVRRILGRGPGDPNLNL